MDRNLKGIMIDDHSLFIKGFKSLISENLNTHIQEFSNGNAAYDKLLDVSNKNQEVDFIITDIEHPGFDGLQLIRKIRRFSEKKLYYNGLKLKYVPIIVLTMHDNAEIREHVSKISKEIIFLTKNEPIENVLKGVTRSIAQYRKEVTEEFTNKGFAIQFENGKYTISNNFDLAPDIKTKYFTGLSDHASKAMTRAILVQNASGVGKISISIFEELLNDPNTAEKDFQEFFRLFPEFLLEGNSDIIHTERSFPLGEKKYRTDIIAQPRGQRMNSDKWTIVELKKHSEKILTDRKYHANFSKAVYNAITQLKNYQTYFNDPANAEKIKKKFNGVLLNPRLSLIIGRTPHDKLNLFSKMKNQFPEISITTYDEILNFRKIQVQYMESLGI